MKKIISVRTYKEVLNDLDDRKCELIRITIIELKIQMRNDLPNRDSQIDLASAYGWYLGIFETYKSFGKLTLKEFYKTWEELSKLYYTCYEKFKIKSKTDKKEEE